MNEDAEHPLATRDATGLWADFDRLFDDLRASDDEPADPGAWTSRFPGWAFLGRPSGGLQPAATDVTDTGPSYRVVAEVPGIPKEQLKIRIRGSSVEIEVEATKESGANDGELLHRERRRTGFYRAFELPEPIVAKDATARVADGLLTLELPKESPTPVAVEVTVPVQ